ncbi:MAG: T9SS type A sorting domain-containing protein [Bacteroidota bacterium]
MKKIYLLLLVIVASLNASAQCTPNPNWNSNGINPNRLPDGEVGQAYSTVISFKINNDTVIVYSGNTYDVTIDSAEVDTIKNLPPGFTYACNNSTCTWPGGGKGCALFSGMPTAQHFYHYEIKIFVKTYLKIKGLDQQIQRIDSSIIDYYTTGKSGVQELNNNTFKIYPNPATASIQIENNNVSAAGDLYISDITGKILINKTLPQNDKQTIDVSAMPKGLYFVTLKNNLSQQTQKLVLN